MERTAQALRELSDALAADELSATVQIHERADGVGFCTGLARPRLIELATAMNQPSRPYLIGASASDHIYSHLGPLTIQVFGAERPATREELMALVDSLREERS